MVGSTEIYCYRSDRMQETNQLQLSDTCMSMVHVATRVQRRASFTIMQVIRTIIAYRDQADLVPLIMATSSFLQYCKRLNKWRG